MRNTGENADRAGALIERSDGPLTPVRVLLAVAAAVLALAAAMVACTAPVADDFHRALYPGAAGALELVRQTYAGQHGRWLAFAVEAGLLANIDLMRHYSLAVAGPGLVFMAGLFVYCKLVLGEWRRRALPGSALVLSALAWVGMPSLPQFVYWVSGFIEYHLPLALLAFLVALLAWPSRRGAPQATAAAALAFAVAGFHELIAMTECVVLLIGAAAAWRAGLPQRRAWLAALVAAVAGMLLVIAAPGNFVRAGRLEGGGLGAGFYWLLHQGVEYLPLWTLDIKLWAATLLLALDPRLASRPPRWAARPIAPWRWIIPAATLALIAGWWWAIATATGWPAPARALNAIYLIFLAGWFATAVAWLGSRPPADPAAPQARRLAGVATVVLALALLLTGNTRTAVSDLLRRAPQWRAAMVERDARLRQAAVAGEREVLVAPAPVEPRVFFLDDVTADPAHWRNVSVARYYGLESVRLRRTTSTAGPDGGNQRPIPAPASSEKN